MGQISSKLRGGYYAFTHWCPGCKEPHTTICADTDSPCWFDGNLDQPTFTPSIKITGKKRTVDEQGRWLGGWVRDADGNTIPWCCHYNVTAGQIVFHGDSTHELRGTTVPLPELPPHMRD